MEHVRSLRTLHVVLCFSARYPDASAPYFFYALSVPRFLNISVSCCSRSCFSGSLRQTVLGSKFLIWAIIFHYLYLSPKLQYSGRSSLLTQFHVWASKTKNRTGSSFPPPYLLFLTLIYPFFNTSGHSACLCSFYPCHIVPRIIFLHPLFFSFLGHALIPTIRPLPCPSQTIYQEWHPFPFHPSSFHHHLQHKTPEVESKRERTRKEEWKTWEEKKKPDLKSLKSDFVPRIG